MVWKVSSLNIRWIASRLAGCFFASTLYLLSGPIVAGPEGGDIVGGAGSIGRAGTTTTIHQQTDLMAIDWRSYNVNANERVDYIQPDSSSLSLNRILSNDGSRIHGQINANGQVILVNPNGIVFGENATINVGGILASGLDINPNDFMNGDFVFSALEDAEGKVINSGLISAATGGSISLVGKQVENNGLIVANLGAVNLAAGKEAIMTFDSSGLIGVRITKEILQNELGIEKAVVNSGDIKAASGQVLLSGSVSEDIFSQAVNTGAQARSVVVHDDGSFTLGAGADVVNSGSIDVSSDGSGDAGRVVVIGENITSSGAVLAQGGGGDIELHSTDTTLIEGEAVVSASATNMGQGGAIRLLGANVGLTGDARISADGVHGGGDVLMGGDRTGANPLVRNADFIYLGQDTSLTADAYDAGNGGKIITFAEDTARIYGELYARGGVNGGGGGFIETSGRSGFEIDSVPSASARSAGGLSGEWLIDPYNITITNDATFRIDDPNGPVFDPNASGANIRVADIRNALQGTGPGNSGSNVIIQTDNPNRGAGEDDGAEVGNISFEASLNLDSLNSDRTLTLIADNDILMTTDSVEINAQGGNGALSLDFQAGGNIEISQGNDIYTNGGNFTASGESFRLTGDGGNNGDRSSLMTAGGDVNLTFTQSVNIGIDSGGNSNGARIETEGGTFTINSSNFTFGTATTTNRSYITTSGASGYGDFILNADSEGAVNIYEDIRTLGGDINIQAEGEVVISGILDSGQVDDFSLLNETEVNGFDVGQAGDINIGVYDPDSPENNRLPASVTTTSGELDTGYNDGGGDVTIFAEGNISLGVINVQGLETNRSSVPVVSATSTTGSIILNSDFNYNGTAYYDDDIYELPSEGAEVPTLFLSAANDITLNGEISDSGPGLIDLLNVILIADSDNNANGLDGNEGLLDFNSDIYTNHGNVIASAREMDFQNQDNSGYVVVSTNRASSGQDPWSIRSTGGSVVLRSSRNLALGEIETQTDGDEGIAHFGQTGESLADFASIITSTCDFNSTGSCGNLIVLARSDTDAISVFDNAALTIHGDSYFDVGSNDGPAFNEITLDRNDNNFNGFLAFSSAGDVSLTNYSGNVVLGGSDIDGTLAISNSGTLTDIAGSTGDTADDDVAEDAVIVSNTDFSIGADDSNTRDILFYNQNNDFGTLNVSRADNLELTDANDINLGSVDIDDGLSLTTVSGSITDSGGSISDAGATGIVVGGDTEFIAGNELAPGDITLDDVDNNFTNIQIVRANDVQLTDINSVNFVQESVVNGDLTVTAGASGDITQSGGSSVQVSGLATFTALDNTVALDEESGNDFYQVGVWAGLARFWDQEDFVAADSTIAGASAGLYWVALNSGTFSQLADTQISNTSGGDIDISADTIEISNISTQSDSLTASGNVTLSGDNVHILANHDETETLIPSIVTNNANASDNSAGNIEVYVTNEFLLEGVVSASANDNGGSTDGSFTVWEPTGGSSTANTFILRNDAAWMSDQDFAINGQSGNDIFDIEAAVDNVILNGGAGTDTFNILALTDNIVINGGGNNDTFNIQVSEAALAAAVDPDPGTIEMTASINGGSGSDTLNGPDLMNYWTVLDTDSTLESEITVDANTSNARITFNGIDTVNGGIGTDTLAWGESTDVSWIIDGADGASNTLNGINFSDMESLDGGAGDDRFIFRNGGLFDGLIDGGLQTLRDTLEVETVGAQLTVELGSETASGDINTTGLERVIGNTGDGTEITLVSAASDDHTWTIGDLSDAADGVNDGSVSSGALPLTEFIDIQNLTGNSGDDTFVFNTGASFTGLLDGGGNSDVGSGGGDSVNYSALAGPVVVSIDPSDSETVTSTIFNIERVTGNSTNSTLSVGSISSDWLVDTVNSGMLTGTSDLIFTDFNILDGGTDVDTFTLNADVTGLVNGGAGADIFNINADVGGDINGGEDSDTFNISSNVTGTIAGDNGADIFTILAAGIDAIINGGEEDTDTSIDILTAYQDSPNYWNINALEGGELSNGTEAPADLGPRITFSEMERLEGSDTQADNFSFGAVADVLMTLVAGASLGDSVDYSNVSGAFNITLDVDESTVGGAEGIETITGNNVAGTSITAPNLSTVWTTTAINSADIDIALAGGGTQSITVLDFPFFFGGSSSDTFNLGHNVTGGVNGRAGADTFNINAVDIATNIVGGTDAGSDVSEDRIFGFEGSANYWALNGGGVNVLANIIGPNTNSTVEVTFSEVEAVFGSDSEIDYFKINASDTGIDIHAGTADGVTDIADFSDITGEFEVNLEDGTNLVTSAERMIGSEGSTLIGNNTGDIWVISDFDEAYLAEDQDPRINGENDGIINGTIEFVDFARLQGGNGSDSFTLVNVGSNSASITGSIDGGDGINTLRGPDASSTWTVNGGPVDSDSPQTITDGASFTRVAAFTRFQQLEGGSGIDSFNVTQGEFTAGNIDGRGGNDRLFVSSQNSDTVTWNITEADQGSVDGFNFESIPNLAGGEGIDIFNLGDNVSGSVNAGGNNDQFNITSNIAGTLNGDDGNDIFDIESSVSGEINGNEGNDNFTIGSTSDLVISSINGGGGVNTLTAANRSNEWIIDASSTLNSTVTFTEMDRLIGNQGTDDFSYRSGTITLIDGGAGTGINTLAGPEQNVTWGITGESSGELSDDGDPATTLISSFLNIRMLQGGSANDRFFFPAASIWSGTLDGGAGSGLDVLQSEHASANTWDITGAGSGDISWLNGGGNNGFTGIETIEGSDASDTFNLRSSGGSINRITGGSGLQDFIVALNEVANKWNITGDDAGNITNSDGSTTFVENFTGIENLTGNDEDDYFDVSLNANISGIVNGGEETENDTLDLRDYGPAVVNLDGEGVEGFNTQDIEVFLVDAEVNNELSGGNVTRDWYIVGEDSVRINERIYTGFSSLTGGNQNDNFYFLEGGLLTGTISGGEGSGTDSITGPNESTTWRINSSESGTIDSILLSGFSMIEEILGGDGQDIFHIDGNVNRIMGGDSGDTFHVTSAFSGVLNGEEGNDIFNLAAAVNSEVLGGEGADTFNVSYYNSDLRLTGGADSDNDTLTLTHSQPADWTLNGDGEEVSVGSASVFFSDIQIVNGSLGADTFDVTGEFAGAVNGRDGGDTFNLQASIVGGATGGAGDNIFNILSASVVTVLTGGDDMDTLAIGHGGDIEWDISLTSGTITNQDDSPGQITFSEMETGEGSAGNDIFNLSASFGRLEGNTGFDVFNIDAPAVNATLIGSSDSTVLNINHAAESNWALDGGEEQVSTDDGLISFSNMGELNGGSARDTFVVTGTFDSASSVNGRGGQDIFNLSAAASAGLNGGDDNDTFNINSSMYSYAINGEGGDGDTLNVEHADNNQWIFDNDGSTVQAESASEATEFQLVEVINGGEGVDTVNFYTNYAGVIDGRGNGDTYTIVNAGVQTEINDSGATGNDSLVVAHDTDTTWTIAGGDSSVTDDSAGNTVFSGVEIATGGDGADNFTIASSLRQVNGGGGSDRFFLGADVTNGVFGNGGEDVFTLLAEGLTLLLNGGSDGDTLIGPDSISVNDWQIVAINEGTLTNNAVVNFEEVENLTGGTGTDRFTLSANLEGDINGADGDDEFIINASGYAYSIDGGNGELDILRIEHSEDTWWTFDGTDTTGGTATAAGAVTAFSSVDSVQGGSGVDTVNIAGSFDGTVDGRDGEDRYLVGETGVTATIADSGTVGADSMEVTHNGGGTWIIDGANNRFTDNDGGQTGFSGIETATGGDGADNFTITASLLQVNGGGGSDQFTVGANVTNGIFGGDGNDTFSLIAEGLSLLLNGGNDNDMLVGADSSVTNQWRITDADEGTLTNGATIDFLEIENLTGGNGDDSYTFVSAGGITGSLSGVIDGGNHIAGDSIDAVQLGGGLTVTMGNGSSDINFVAIEQIEVAEAPSGASGEFNELIGNNSLNFWTFDGRNTGTLEDIDAGTTTRFIGFQNITGGNGADTFTLVGSAAGVDGTIDGAGQPADSFDAVDFSGIPVAHTVYIGDGVNGITGVEGFTGYRPGTVGEGQRRTLVGRDYDGNIWTISNFDGDVVLADGINDGRYQEGISGPVVSFVNFDRLVGGSLDDTFTFYDGAHVTGEIDGRGGRNVVDADSGATETTGRDLVAQLNGSLANILNLVNIHSVIANEGNNNTLIAGNLGVSHAWTIDTDNGGEVNGIDFANFTNLTGSDTVVDSFELQGTASVTGLIDGGSGVGDSVDLSGLNDGVDVTVQIGSTVNNNLNITNIENVTANENNNNRLIADNRANTWNINGINQGNIEHTGNILAATTTAFDGFANLSGGSVADLFVFDGEDNVTGLLDGGGGADELRLAGLTRDVSVVLDSVDNNIQNELNAIRFETISANTAYNNTLIAGNDPNLVSVSNTWTIETENEGRLNDIIMFDGFDNLVGNNANDYFEFSLLGAITGYLDGGDESNEDVVDMSLLATVSVRLGNSANSMREIERFVGNNRNSTLIADNVPNTWELLSGVNDGTLNGLIFTDFNHLVGGSGRDVFTVNGGSVTGDITGAGGNDVVNLTIAAATRGELDFIGGDQNDTLIISGGNETYSVAYSPDVAGESRLVYSDSASNAYTVSYRTAEVIQDNVTAGLLTVNGSVNAENIALSNNRITIENHAPIDYDNKNNLIIAGAADDTVMIDGVVNVPEQLSIRNSAVSANDDAMVVANTVLFSATGQVGGLDNNVVMDVDNLLVRAANGDIYLENSDSINIGELSTANRFNLIAAGQVSSSAALSSQGAVSITANNGNIELANPSNTFEGPVSLNAANNSIALVNNSTTYLAGVSAQTFNVISTGEILDSGPIVVNGLATLESTSSIGLDNNSNDFNSVSVVDATDVTLVDSNQLILANFDGSGTLNTRSTGLVINGAIQAGGVNLDAQSGTATIANVINVNGGVNVQANNIAIENSVTANDILLTSESGGINLDGALNGTGGGISLSSGSAGIQHNGQISSAGGDILLETTGNIAMGTSAQTASVDGLVSYIADGNIDVTDISAGTGTISLQSGARITDMLEGSADIVANRVEITGNDGVGGTNDRAVFELDVAELFVVNNDGNVRINNTDAILIDRLRNNGDIYISNDTGDIVFNNEPDNAYDRNQADARLAGGVSNANYNEGLITIESVTGSILATGNPDATQPDIVGRNAVLLAPFGEIGFGGRPLVIYVRDTLEFQGVRSLRPFWGFNTEPETFINQSLQLDLLDLISLGGEQLVEVEELEDVNPAIFTAVTNYFYDDISIRLPNDQLYEDELEELNVGL